MLTDISPSVTVAGQFYGSQIQTMGIANIAQHIQKQPVSRKLQILRKTFFKKFTLKKFILISKKLVLSSKTSILSSKTLNLKFDNFNVVQCFDETSFWVA
jgi:hypothetical protein